MLRPFNVKVSVLWFLSPNITSKYYVNAYFNGLDGN